MRTIDQELAHIEAQGLEGLHHSEATLSESVCAQVRVRACIRARSLRKQQRINVTTSAPSTVTASTNGTSCSNGISSRRSSTDTASSTGTWSRAGLLLRLTSYTKGSLASCAHETTRETFRGRCTAQTHHLMLHGTSWSGSGCIFRL